jgi:sugar lactone lactonase YvrE
VATEAVRRVNVTEVDGVRLTWGESVRWDDARDRLYLVDCATQKLHWLEDAEPPLHELQLPSLPCGVVLTDGPRGELVICLDDGLHVVDVDAGTTELLAAYPEGMHGRANDAVADGHGRLVTGTLNMGAGPPGALWRYAVDDGWVLLDPSFGNTNGPNVVGDVLLCGDTSAAAVFAYDYDGATGTTSGDKRVHLDQSDPALAGVPDGATVDADGGLWSCVLRSGRLAHVTADGTLAGVVDLPLANPSDVAFAGPDLDRLFVTSIALDLGEGRPPTPAAGALLVLDDLGVTGRVEPRFALHG